MIAIYTSYFGNLKKLPPDEIIPVSIAGKTPEWFTGYKYKPLSPQYDWWSRWKNHPDRDGAEGRQFYVESYYNNVLTKLDPFKVYFDLVDISRQDFDHGYKDIALICYEKPEQFCHRHIVGHWLYHYLGDYFLGEWGTKH